MSYLGASARDFLTSGMSESLNVNEQSSNISLGSNRCVDTTYRGEPWISQTLLACELGHGRLSSPQQWSSHHSRSIWTGQLPLLVLCQSGIERVTNLGMRLLQSLAVTA